MAAMAPMRTFATGDIDQFAGANTSNEVSANNTNTGNTNMTVSVTLDLTPVGGYNGINNFGNVVFSVAGVNGYTTAPSVFGANAPIQFLTLGWGGLTNPGPVIGSYAALSLTQIVSGQRMGVGSCWPPEHK